jgi:hypothetical protein
MTMATLLEPAENDGRTYFRLAWVTEEKHPHPFGKRFRSRDAARRAAPGINRERIARGLIPANYVLELNLRGSRHWPFGRYVAGSLHPLPRTRIVEAQKTV